MHIEHLETFHVRNLDRISLELSPHTVVLEGPNAQGKTNILEALYVSATGKSFRSSSPRELLRHETERGWIKARFVRQGVRHDVEVTLTPQRRGMQVDGRGIRSAAKLLELVNVVAFFPDDLHIVKGSPEGRRRFVDRAVANHRPEFVDASLSYAKALKQRNALLRAPRGVDRSLLEVYDQQLIEHGWIIHRCREQTLAALAPLTRARFRSVMQTELPLELGLRSGVSEPGDFTAAFHQALARSFPADRARGVTHVGPHRADLLLTLSGRSARQFASQGQQRALVLALKLAEVSYLAERLGTPPILLLDDVSSELDRERTAALFAEVTALGSQVWVSTTGAATLPLPPEAQVFAVRAGGTTPKSPA